MSTVMTGLFKREGISIVDFRVGPRVDVEQRVDSV